MLTVTVTTAVKLSSNQLSTLKKALEKKQDQPVDLKQIVDPAVISGLRLTIGSKQIDGTGKNMLEQIEKQLLEIAQ